MACVNASIWRAVGSNNLGFKAVHLGPEIVDYENAKEYCETLGAVLPNYFTKEVEQRLNTIRDSDLLVIILLR